MKKLFALILASVLLLSVPVALGEDKEYSGWNALVQSPTSTITMTVEKSDDSFVIVIPATLTVDMPDMTGSMNVTLQGGYKLYGPGIQVKLAASSSDMKLTNTTNSDDKLSYTLHITAPEGLDVNWNGSEQALFRTTSKSGSSDITATLTVTVTGMPSVGTYTDTLTFIIF